MLLIASRYCLQHYMLNNEINEQLVHTSSVEEGDLVLEIGPGTGSLTNALINAGATVLAIEKVLYASLSTLGLLTQEPPSFSGTQSPKLKLNISIYMKICINFGPVRKKKSCVCGEMSLKAFDMSDAF